MERGRPELTPFSPPEDRSPVRSNGLSPQTVVSGRFGGKRDARATTRQSGRHGSGSGALGGQRGSEAPPAFLYAFVRRRGPSALPPLARAGSGARGLPSRLPPSPAQGAVGRETYTGETRRSLLNTTLRQGWPLVLAQGRNVRSKCRCSCVLQFTRRRAVCCVFHRPTSRVIHRSG